MLYSVQFTDLFILRKSRVSLMRLQVRSVIRQFPYLLNLNHNFKSRSLPHRRNHFDFGVWRSLRACGGKYVFWSPAKPARNGRQKQTNAC